MSIEIGGVSTGAHNMDELFETDYDISVARLVLSGIQHRQQKAKQAYINREEERLANSLVYEWS